MAKIFIPLMGMMGKKNLRDTANALQRYEYNDVFVLYDMVTNTPAGTSFVCEWYQVKGE